MLYLYIVDDVNMSLVSCVYKTTNNTPNYSCTGSPRASYLPGSYFCSLLKLSGIFFTVIFCMIKNVTVQMNCFAK